MTKPRYVLELDDWERKLLVGCLVEARNSFLDKDTPIEDVCGILKKAINAPPKKTRKKERSEAR